MRRISWYHSIPAVSQLKAVIVVKREFVLGASGTVVEAERQRDIEWVECLQVFTEVTHRAKRFLVDYFDGWSRAFLCRRLGTAFTRN